MEPSGGLLVQGQGRLLVGLLAFSLGLALFVSPRAVAEWVGDRVGREAGHWATVAVRTAGILGMAFGFAFVVT